MGRIRILVVDDSVVVRRLLTKVLSSDPDLEVVGSAPNGRIALAKVPQLNPDLVTLDLDMPEGDGPQTLSALHKSYPKLPVITFTVLTNQTPATAIDMLTLGACDYITRAVNGNNVEAAEQLIRDELAPKIKMHGSTLPGEGRVSPLVSLEPGKINRASARVARTIPKSRIDVLVIGVSTGGPNALAELLGEFPSDFPVPVLVVQHMPSAFTNLLAERLDKSCQIRVLLGKPNETVEPGRAWVAPGNFHMAVRRDQDAVRIETNQEPPENSCRPSADVLFRSAAQVYGSHVLGVVLTGMGQDGLRGAEKIREAGGQIFVQDEASSVVWGMPGFIANAGLADKVLPLSQLGSEIVKSVWEYRSTWSGPRSVKSHV